MDATATETRAARRDFRCIPPFITLAQGCGSQKVVLALDCLESQLTTAVLSWHSIAIEQLARLNTVHILGEHDRSQALSWYEVSRSTRTTLTIHNSTILSSSDPVLSDVATPHPRQSEPGTCGLAKMRYARRPSGHEGLRRQKEQRTDHQSHQDCPRNHIHDCQNCLL